MKKILFFLAIIFCPQLLFSDSVQIALIDTAFLKANVSYVIENTHELALGMYQGKITERVELDDILTCELYPIGITFEVDDKGVYHIRGMRVREGSGPELTTPIDISSSDQESAVNMLKKMLREGESVEQLNGQIVVKTNYRSFVKAIKLFYALEKDEEIVNHICPQKREFAVKELIKKVKVTNVNPEVVIRILGESYKGSDVSLVQLSDDEVGIRATLQDFKQIDSRIRRLNGWSSSSEEQRVRMIKEVKPSNLSPDRVFHPEDWKKESGKRFDKKKKIFVDPPFEF